METGKLPFLRIHHDDNVLVALQDLEKGRAIDFEGQSFELADPIPAKHKFSLVDLNADEDIYMYGVLVGKTNKPIPKGGLLTTGNIHHATKEFHLGARKLSWKQPDVSRFEGRTFNGFHRSDGSVGTANYWIVLPLVFCENRNIQVLKEAFVENLGYKKTKAYDHEVAQLMSLYKAGKSVEEILSADMTSPLQEDTQAKRLFKNIDGIKFLPHQMGCGESRADSQSLCGLLAGYITHPNVAGATVLSLGCQHAQLGLLRTEISKRDQSFDKPLIFIEQQKVGTERNLIETALKQTFAGLVQANSLERKPASLEKLCVGVKCGGSDGFSGISANPAVGYLSDMMVALGGSVILAEFPELCGVEQELSDRCIDEATAQRFMHLMTTYNARAEANGSGFYANPSPGNIKDGLITDAIKSAGAAKKGGLSPVKAVLDFPEPVRAKGLSLLCTPGSDVECVTAEVGSGANVVLFTTGLGTPTGNPVAPVIKLSTNTALFNKMPDIIDINCGTVIEGTETIHELGERILDFVIQVASGDVEPKAMQLGQDDFMPWKRGLSL